MVIARYSGRVPAMFSGIGESNATPSEIVWRALCVAGLCAACAFFFFLVSERNLLRRSGQTDFQGSITTQRVNLQSTVETPRQMADARELPAPAPDSPLITPPREKNTKITEFVLTESPEFQQLGRIELKLTALDTGRGSFDLTVRTPVREFYRKDVKINEHVPLSRKARHGPEVVVGAIVQNRAWGYLSEPVRAAAHKRRRHRA